MKQETQLSRRALLRAVMLGGLGLLAARVLARQGKGSAGGSVCRHTCDDCRQRTICNLPEASLARKERRHGTK
jgi:hypothetical protein